MTTAPLSNLTATWNASGTTFSAIKMNVTDTASAAGSLLLDLQVGGVSRFRVNKDGNIIFGGTSSSILARSVGTGVRFDNFASAVNSHGLAVANTSDLGFVWANEVNNPTVDLALRRDATDTLAQRRGTNAQAFRIYNTFTDASNYERLAIRNATGYWRIHPEKAGTGTDQHVGIYNTGQQSGTNWDANGWTTYTNGIDRWRINTSGHLLALTDNTFDIGASGANRPRNVFWAGYQEMSEMTAPAAPATNNVRIYAEDNGSGKTRLMALFATGAAVQIAIEP